MVKYLTSLMAINYVFAVENIPLEKKNIQGYFPCEMQKILSYLIEQFLYPYKTLYFVQNREEQIIKLVKIRTLMENYTAKKTS